MALLQALPVLLLFALPCSRALNFLDAVTALITPHSRAPADVEVRSRKLPRLGGQTGGASWGPGEVKEPHPSEEDLRLRQDMAPTPPVWPRRFQLDFNEENYFLFFTLKTKGNYFYDFENSRVRIDRADGLGDRYCGSAMPGYSTPCTHLVNSSMRYLIFPEKQYCCKCCSSAQGCGALSRDWLANATFVGYDYLFGIMATKWNVPGLQNNYYWHAVDGVPVRIYQEPVTQMTFSHSTFVAPTAFPDALFNVPDDLDCSPQCYGVCGFL